MRVADMYILKTERVVVCRTSQFKLLVKFCSIFSTHSLYSASQ